MTLKTNFTKAFIESLKATHKILYCYDLKVRGLGIYVTKKGIKTFFVYRKIQGKPERIILGRYPDLSIEQARVRAFEVNAKIGQGGNPNQERTELREEITLKTLFDLYLERYAKVHKKSWESDASQYRLYLSGWGQRKISQLLRCDIEKLHAKIGEEHGKYTANRLLALLSTIINKAIAWGWKGSNPVIGIKKFREQSRERFLQGDELPNFFKALGEESNRDFADFFIISLLTGARKNNVLSMRWRDINLAQAIWEIPETKNGGSQHVHLSQEALTILQERFSSKQSIWVFPSLTSKSGHLEEPKSAWKRLLKRAGISNLRLHDLRRTLGSWQAATGANSYVIGKSLGHKTQQATAIYARINLDPVRESVNKATQAIFQASGTVIEGS